LSASFEELDWRITPLGALSLRRRFEPRAASWVLEIKLGDAFLMSSLFTASETALAHVALDRLEGTALDVLVGGLGLGYTARAARADDRVGELVVLELLEPVIAWHRAGLVPLGAELVADPRCRLVEGDLFALAAAGDGLDPRAPGRRFDAVLVDIDHSPEARLDARSDAFYGPDGLAALGACLRPGGVFALWSNEPPDEGFRARLAAVFANAEAVPVTFDNPLRRCAVTQTIYVARTASRPHRQR
jgi:spermidine synthase